jgi:hypothetical protein
MSALTLNKVEQSSIGSMYPAVDTDMLRVTSFGSDGLMSHGCSSSLQEAGPRLSAVLAGLQKEGLSTEGAARITAEFALLKESLSNSQQQLQIQKREIQELLDERRQLQTEMVAEHTQRNGVVFPPLCFLLPSYCPSIHLRQSKPKLTELGGVMMTFRFV